MNQAQFFGRLGADSRLATSKAGNAYLKFDFAVNVFRKGKTETLWVRCTVFGKQAESLALQLLKGTQAVVSGSVDLNTFIDRDGKTRTDLDLIVHSVSVASAAAAAAQKSPAPDLLELADDIPF